MKYIIFIFIMLLTVSCSLKGCNKDQEETLIFPPKGSETHQCTNPISCPIRLERLACTLAERTEQGLIEWHRVDRVGGGHYFAINITDNANVIVNENYMWVDISVPPYTGNSVDRSVNNSCAKALYKYLTDKTSDKAEAEKQKALEDFLNTVEKKYEIQLEAR